MRYLNPKQAEYNLELQELLALLSKCSYETLMAIHLRTRVLLDTIYSGQTVGSGSDRSAS